jgi:Flp pilus assembly protein TadG
MFREFLRDVGGNFAISFTVAIVPIMGGVSLAIDYGELTRQKQATLNALDAAGIATARQIVSGADEAALKAYARDFFDANLGPVKPENADLIVTLPTKQAGGGTLKLKAELTYQPYFLPVFKTLIGDDGPDDVSFSAGTEIRLKNTLEVALVLDNSGSMAYEGSGSGEARLTLLQTAAKQLVDTIALQASMMKQIDRPVQFSLVPFAGSVNVGAANASAAWMDTTGISPVHHEHFDWTTVDDGNRKVQQQADGTWRKTGSDWGLAENEIVTRFTLFRDVAGEVEQDDDSVVASSFQGWSGCVEARPHPHNVNDTAPNASDPVTLFVPMFAPDEPGDRWKTEADGSPDGYSAPNNWWNDGTESSSGQTRLRNAAKYFDVSPHDADIPAGVGPNYSCTTSAITPLTDVSTEDGLAAVKTAIDGMTAEGATNVPEGLAWGWRTLSSTEPFIGGRPETEKGNDKVVIVLTDGANTYYTPGSLGFSDKAGAKSTYSAHGYLQPNAPGTTKGRLFQGTSVSQTYSNATYTTAMNQHLASACAKAKEAGVIIMTVALDLDATNDTQASAIEGMRSCASESRYRSDPANPGHAAKLFWNATGATLSQHFKEIADELSNLRIVG